VNPLYRTVAGTRMEVILTDLDSTLADTRQRRHLCPTVDAARTWSAYAMACSNDAPMLGPIAALRMFHAAGYGVHIVTNRPECSRALTERWLRTHCVAYEVLRMRPDDSPFDGDIKLAYLDEIRATGYAPLLFLEDWAETAAAIEAAGVPTLCLNPRYQLAPV